MKKTQSDPYQNNKQRIYVDADLWKLFKAACAAVGKAPSVVLSRKAKSYVRANAVKLRKAGHRVPESILMN